jgi:hypothetical protein
MPPLRLDVIALVPQGWGLCQSCEMLMAGAGLSSAPSDRGLEEISPEISSDFRHLSELLLDLSARYGDRLLIRIYNPFSMLGLVRSLRFGVRRYPTFVVAGKTKVTGWQIDVLEEALRAHGL